MGHSRQTKGMSLPVDAQGQWQVEGACCSVVREQPPKWTSDHGPRYERSWFSASASGQASVPQTTPAVGHQNLYLNAVLVCCYRGRILSVRGHCNSCLGNLWGTTAIQMTDEGPQRKFKNSKGTPRQTMHLLSLTCYRLE